MQRPWGASSGHGIAELNSKELQSLSRKNLAPSLLRKGLKLTLITWLLLMIKGLKIPKRKLGEETASTRGGVDL